ncbi:uncharacterized protein LOC144637982 isoform X2 [Oculina patagonica]
MAEEGELSSPDELETSCDAVELNVLKDILGEPANDEFAAELDTQTKTSAPSRKRKARSDDKNDASKKRHVDSPKNQAKENSSGGQSSKSSSQIQTKTNNKTASSTDVESPGDDDKEKLQMKDKEEKERHKIKPKEKDKAQNVSQLENENVSKEKGKEKDSSKNKQKDLKCHKNDSDSKFGDKEVKKKEEQKSEAAETKEVLEKEVKTVEAVSKKTASPKSKETSKEVKKDTSKKETGKKEIKKNNAKKAAEVTKGQGKVAKEKVKPLPGEKKADTSSSVKKEAKQSVQGTPAEVKSSKTQEPSSTPAEKTHQKQAHDGVTGKGGEGNEVKKKSTEKKKPAAQVKSKKVKVSKSSGKETKQTEPAVEMEQDENKVQDVESVAEPVEEKGEQEIQDNDIDECDTEDKPETKDSDGAVTGSSVENKGALAEEAEAASKYVVGEDMEVIDDLEEGSDGGSNESGDEFSEAEEGSATPSSSASSKSESENASDKEEKPEEERTKVKRRKRKATSPVAVSDESDNSDSADSLLHIKSKVAKASSSKSKKKFNMDDFFEEARYFVMKSNNHENVALSKAKGVWSTPKANEKKLNATFKRYKNVILIFSVKESGKFQGFARLASEAKHGGQPMPWVLPPGMSAKALGGVFKLEWLNRRELWFSKCLHLRNPWNDNKEVKICRDGQEVEPSVGEALCRLFPEDETVDINTSQHSSESRRRRKERDPARHRPRHSDELRKSKRKHRVSASRHHSRDHHDPLPRYEDRSRYAGVRRETLLHGSYSDYMREYQRSRHSSSLPPMRSHFSSRAVDVPSYYPLHIGHSSSRSGGYHRSVDTYAAACDEFLRRTQSDRGSSSRYRSRRR